MLLHYFYYTDMYWKNDGNLTSKKNTHTHKINKRAKEIEIVTINETEHNKTNKMDESENMEIIIKNICILIN